MVRLLLCSSRWKIFFMSMHLLWHTSDELTSSTGEYVHHNSFFSAEGKLLENFFSGYNKDTNITCYEAYASIKYQDIFHSDCCVLFLASDIHILIVFSKTIRARFQLSRKKNNYLRYKFYVNM